MLTLATCSFNTPKITLNMIDSYYNHNEPTNLLISDNSTNDDTATLLSSEGISYYRNPGFHHSIGVDFLIEKCDTKYMLLVDTDVIFLKNIVPLFERLKFYDAAICGVKQGSRGGLELHDRICPWFCFIDIEKIKANNIKFFDGERFSQHLHLQDNSKKIYDVGATFLEDIIKADLKVFEITEYEQDIYIKHFEGMSWRKDSNNAGLISLAERVEKEYLEFVEWQQK